MAGIVHMSLVSEERRENESGVIVVVQGFPKFSRYDLQNDRPKVKFVI